VAKYPFAEDVYEAVKFRIAREPGVGTVMPGTTPRRQLVWVMSNPIAKSPGLLVRYYQKKEKTCEITIDWIKFFPFDPAVHTGASPGEYIILGA